MPEIDELEEFHPRAIKLMRKRKNFVVVACDEPYFLAVYDMIRTHEITKGTWTKADESCYIRSAEQRNEAVEAGQKSPCLTPTQHSWKDEYYGYKCERCEMFVPYGSEWWLPVDE